MMFRSSHADEESGSDWDDYSPTSTPQPPPEHSTSSAAHHKPLPRSANLSSAAQPHPHSHTPSGNKQYTHEVAYKQQTSQGYRVYIDQAKHSMIDDNVKPLETELTRLSTVSPPQTPAYSSAPVHTKPATLYRTIEEEDPGNNINGEPTGDHDQLVHAHHSVHAAGGGNGAMEFCHVDAQSSEILSPSYEPSYSYMSGVADKSEEYARRCVEEVFSTLRVVSDFIIVFLLGCCQYLLNSVTRKLCCGLAHICTDSLCKPLVQVCFNGCCWPVLSMYRHICQGVVIALNPLLDIVRSLVAMAVNLVAACRPVQVNIQHKHLSNA